LCTIFACAAKTHPDNNSAQHNRAIRMTSTPR
jgi:hypothetical protein